MTEAVMDPRSCVAAPRLPRNVDYKNMIGRWLKENRYRAERLLGDQFNFNWRRIANLDKSWREIWEDVQEFSAMLDELENIDDQGQFFIDTQAKIILDDIAQAQEAGHPDQAENYRKLLKRYYTRPELVVSPEVGNV